MHPCEPRCGGRDAATDGPVPVRVLAQAARLCREARHLPRYGIEIGDIALDYERLLQRAHEVVGDVGKYAMLRSELDDAGWPCAGTARFVDPHTIATENGPTLRAEKLILCAGGTNRLLPVPGAELVGSHRDAWTLSSVPDSLLVIGAGTTGAQVASVPKHAPAKTTMSW